MVDDAATTGPGFGDADDRPPSAPSIVAGATARSRPPRGAVHHVPQPVALNCLDSASTPSSSAALDCAGNWGVVGSVIFNLPKTGPQTTNGSLADVPANGAWTVTISRHR